MLNHNTGDSLVIVKYIAESNGQLASPNNFQDAGLPEKCLNP